VESGAGIPADAVEQALQDADPSRGTVASRSLKSRDAVVAHIGATLECDDEWLNAPLSQQRHLCQDERL
jgi:hypothetical protein